MATALIPLKQCGIGDAGVVGQAAAVLGELAADGMPVPDGAVFIPAAAELSDADLGALLGDVTAMIGSGRYAVRASTVGEVPGADAVPDVDADGLVAAVRSCWAAGDRSPGATAQGHAPVAVLVQRRVRATAAGVAFASDRAVLVNAVPGPPGAGDAALPDEWLVHGGVATCRRSPHDAVDAATVLAVAELAGRVERRLGGPQDVEWALDDGRAVLEHGVRLAERKVLERRDDVFWLTLPRATAALRATSPRATPADATAMRAEIAQSVARAKGAHAWIERHPAPVTYGRRPAPPPALGSLPPEAQFAMRAMMWSVESILAPESSNRDASPTAVAGIPAVPGRYTGPVRIVRDESELGRI